MPILLLAQILAFVVLGAYALVVLITRFFPGATISLWLKGVRQSGRRERSSDLTAAAAYHVQLPLAQRGDALDEHTWQDLDLNEVFCAVDHTVSEPGRQYLYHRLRTPRLSREWLARLETAVGRLASDGDLLARVRASLARLDDPRASEIVNLLFGEIPSRPRGWWLFPLLTSASIGCVAMVGVWPQLLVVWVSLWLVNLFVQLSYRPRVKRFIPALHEVPAFLRVARELGAMDFVEASAEFRRLRDGASKLKPLRWICAWLMADPGEDAGGLTASAYEYANLLFLLDVNAFVAATESLRTSRALLLGMFEAIGYVDAVQSIAAWRNTLARWTLPEFTEVRKALHLEGLSHPLVNEPVPNSLDLSGAGLLITGSNMSGKTTFLRALGINAILAQTLHTACADVWRAPLLHVRTSIGRTDSVLEGKSYYMAEVESVRSLLLAKNNETQHLFLLDEIFRGTNTTERIAAGRAVLAYLNRGHDLVAVATHDIELIALLGDSYVPYHFREEIVGGAVTFDYRIRTGPSSSRNAIALLELMDYPPDVVRDALATVDWKAG